MIKNIYIAVILLLFLSAVPVSLFSQGDTTMVKELTPKIEIIAQPLKDSILLRWAPNQSLLWEQANQAGYLVERVTLLRDGKMLTPPQRVMLTSQPYKPKPLETWESAVKNGKYAAIAAQALFGKTFDVKNQAPLYAVITKVRERDSRFSFALFAADQSPEVARLSGLWYADKNVKSNEKYLYRVFLAGGTVKADTGFVYTGLSEYAPLPKPIDLKAEFADHVANLTWNRLYFERIYNAYILERSGDGGKTFRSVTDEPLVNLTQAKQPTPDLFFKTDSLPENGKTYFYRVRGLSSFGQTSEPSDVVSGAGHDVIPFAPYITEKTVVDNQKVWLKWEFPADKVSTISGFKIARSSNPSTGFVYIAENISATSHEFTDTKPLLTNYYVITAVNKFGEALRSSPVLVQLVDSIPPAPPTGIVGKVDSTGKVTLCWKANNEDDIYGYRIYRSNSANDEYSQITVAPVKDTFFVDRINVKTLTRTVFYRLMAIDKRQNHSAFSEPAELKRPDITPPVSPLFKVVKSSSEGVWLEWINSTSPDTKSHLLYRSIPNSKQWRLIGAFDMADSITTYMDKEADSLDYCNYILLARDWDNNESKPSASVSGKKIDNGIRPGIAKVFSEVSREKGTIQLAWTSVKGNVYRYLIYRAKGDAPLTLFTSVPGNATSFTDNKLMLNTRYQYSIKVFYVDGSQSGFSVPKEVNY